MLCFGLFYKPTIKPNMKIFKLSLLLLLFTATATMAQKKAIYAGFPEDFESPDTSAKNRYKLADVKLKTGAWTFDQALLGGEPKRDKFSANGKQSVRFQQNKNVPAILAMKFDLPDGASKVTFTYASYYKDANCVFKFEYSIDGGVNWLQAGKDIAVDNLEPKTAEFALDLKGKVRFRINKLGLGDGKADPVIKNGRLCVDDFTVYSN
jgi:hypothetical protein